MSRRPVVSLLSVAGALALATMCVAPSHAQGLGGDSEAAYVMALESRLHDASAADVARLSDGDLALLAKYARPVAQESATTVQSIAPTDPRVAGLAAATGDAAAALCYTATSSRTAKGTLGNNLYRSWHVGRWCRSGTTVTSASRVEQGWQTYWLGWSGKGLIGGSSAVVSNQGRSYSQHSFQFQLGTPAPTQFTQPCTRIRGTATPGFFADYVCGLYS